jgi:hypothetical protein
MDYWGDWDYGNISSRIRHILKYDKRLDYALLQLAEALGNTYGYLEIETNDDVLQSVDAVKIIQHPKARSKEIVRRNTRVIGVKPAKNNPEVLHYLADTDVGSSGSPVFSRHGSKVIAIHHAGEDQYNEGVLMSRIFKGISPWLSSSSSSSSKRPSSPPSSSTPNNGMGTGTKIALGAGAVAALGGGVALATSSKEDGTTADDSNNDDSNNPLTGKYVSEETIEPSNTTVYREDTMYPSSRPVYRTVTLTLKQNGTSITGTWFSSRTFSNCCTANLTMSVSGDISGSTLRLGFYEIGEASCQGNDCSYSFIIPMYSHHNFYILENNSILRSTWGGWADFIRR